MSDYSDSGFDAFLSRSVDDIPQVNLDSAGPASTQMPFDRAQVSGHLGDTLSLGNIVFDGKSGTITIASTKDSASIVIDGDNRRILISDENNHRVVIGNLSN